MSKKINKERAIALLDLIQDKRCKHAGLGIDLMRLFARLGVKKSLYPNLSPEQIQLEINKIRLDLNILELELDEQQLNQIMDDAIAISKRYSHFEEKVFEICNRYKVSDLAPRTIEVKGRTIETIFEGDRLRLIDADLPIVRAEIPKLLRFFLEAHAPGDKFWRFESENFSHTKYGTWVEVSPEKIGLVASDLSNYDWGLIWQLSGEYHLCFGQGTDVNSPRQVEFCLFNRCPSY